MMMTAVRIENTDVRAAKKKDAEIEKAISLGLVPKALQRDYGKTITLSEYASMFDQVIKKATPGRLKEWQKKSKRFRRAKAKMTRNFGAQALLTAAIATGADDNRL